MANTSGSAGGGSGTDDTSSGTSGSSGGGGIDWPEIGGRPDWLKGGMPGWFDDAASFFEDPTDRIREVVFGMLIGGIAAFVEPILAAIQLVFAGSNPSVYAAPNEQYGLLDLPVLAADLLGSAVSIPVRAAFDSLTSIIGAFTFGQGSPATGIIVNAVVVLVVIAVVRYGPLVLRAGLEAIPVIGGPLSTLLGGSK